MRIYSVRNKLRRAWGVDTRSRKRPGGRQYIVGTKEQALAELARIQAKPDTPGNYTHDDLNQFVNRYLEWRESRSPGFIKKDRARFQSIIDFFGSQKITKLGLITPGHLQEFETSYLKTHARKSWNNVLEQLKGILNRAVDWGVIGVNPIAKVKSLRLDKSFHYFALDECKLIISQAEEPLKSAIIFLLHTGMRRSELYNLRWRDIDLPNRKITVKPYRGYSTKSKRGRTIPISDALAKSLKVQGRNNDYACRPYGGLNTLYKKFSSLLKSLNLSGNLHDLRHTFASHAAMSGVPIPVIQRWLGHADIQTTMIYAHLSPDMDRQEMAKMAL
jgi:integrase